MYAYTVNTCSLVWFDVNNCHLNSVNDLIKNCPACEVHCTLGKTHTTVLARQILHNSKQYKPLHQLLETRAFCIKLLTELVEQLLRDIYINL